MNRVERRILDRLLHTTRGRQRQQAEAILMSSNGQGYKEIAEHLKQPAYIVKVWLKKFADNGLEALGFDFDEEEHIQLLEEEFEAQVDKMRLGKSGVSRRQVDRCNLILLKLASRGVAASNIKLRREILTELSRNQPKPEKKDSGWTRSPFKS